MESEREMLVDLEICVALLQRLREQGRSDRDPLLRAVGRVADARYSELMRRVVQSEPPPDTPAAAPTA